LPRSEPRYLDLCPPPRLMSESSVEVLLDRNVVRHWHERYPVELIWVEFIHQLAVRTVRASSAFDDRPDQRLLPVRLEDFSIPQALPQGRYIAVSTQSGPFFRVTVASGFQWERPSVIATACIGQVRMGAGA